MRCNIKSHHNSLAVSASKQKQNVYIDIGAFGKDILYNVAKLRADAADFIAHDGNVIKRMREKQY